MPFINTKDFSELYPAFLEKVILNFSYAIYILKIMPQVSLSFSLCFLSIIIKYSTENIFKYCIINDLLFLEYIKIEENQKEMK